MAYQRILILGQVGAPTAPLSAVPVKLRGGMQKYVQINAMIPLKIRLGVADLATIGGWVGKADRTTLPVSAFASAPAQEARGQAAASDL